MEAFLVDYPLIQVSSTFKTIVNPCIVLNLQSTENSDKVYEVNGKDYDFSLL